MSNIFDSIPEYLGVANYFTKLRVKKEYRDNTKIRSFNSKYAVFNVYDFVPYNGLDYVFYLSLVIEEYTSKYSGNPFYMISITYNLVNRYNLVFRRIHKDSIVRNKIDVLELQEYINEYYFVDIIKEIEKI